MLENLKITFDLLPFVVVTVLFLVICYYILIKKNAIPGSLKFLIPAVGLAFLFFHFMWIINLAGSPINGIPKTEFTYLTHRLVSKTTVELWVLNENKESKLYRFDLSEENKQKLAKARARAEQGAKIKGKFKGKRGVRPTDPRDTDLEISDNRDTSVPSKDYDGPRP